MKFTKPGARILAEPCTTTATPYSIGIYEELFVTEGIPLFLPPIFVRAILSLSLLNLLCIIPQLSKRNLFSPPSSRNDKRFFGRAAIRLRKLNPMITIYQVAVVSISGPIMTSGGLDATGRNHKERLL